MGKLQQLLLTHFQHLEFQSQLEHQLSWRMWRNWKTCRAGCRLYAVSPYCHCTGCSFVAGGDGESCVGLIFVIFPAVGNGSAAFRYFCVVHKMLLCVVTCKSKFIYFLVITLFLLLLHYLFMYTYLVTCLFQRVKYF